MTILLRWTMHGVRPRDWDAGLAALLEPPEGSREEYLLLLAYYHTYDRGDIERARRLLDRAIALLSEGSVFNPTLIRAEAAYPFSLEEHTRRRAEAAVRFAEGRYAEAVAAAEAGIDAVPRSRDPGGAKAERDWLEAVRTASQRALDRELEAYGETGR